MESPLEQSVVNLTTDVDASTPLRSLASGEAQEKGTTSTSNSESSTINTVIAESDDGGKPGGLDSGDPSSEIVGN